MLSILSINEISVNETQIQLSTKSTQYVAEFSFQAFFARAKCYTRCTSFDEFLFLWRLCTFVWVARKTETTFSIDANDCHDDTSLTAKFTNALSTL